MPYTKEELPYQAHSLTSEMAADSMASAAETQRQEILLFTQGRGAQGATDEEIRDGMSILMNSVNPRRGELVKMGLVADSGEMRKTKQNRWATVWKSTPYCATALPPTKKSSLKRENVRLRTEVEALREENAQLCGYNSYAEQLFQEGLRTRTGEAVDAALAPGVVP